MFLFQPNAKPRRFWLVEPPRVTSTNRAPIHRLVLFEILTRTFSKMKACEAATIVVDRFVLPFYTAAGITTLTRNAVIHNAVVLFQHYHNLMKNARTSPKKRGPNFNIRCDDFPSKLDSAFLASPDDDLSAEEAVSVRPSITL